MKHKKLQIFYERGEPYGIFDDSGFLFFFCNISKYTDQEEHYRQEIEERYRLADYLLEKLKERV